MQFSLLKEALRASGLADQARQATCSAKLDRMYERIRTRVLNEAHPRNKARIIFDWLWAEKPERYLSGGSFRINEVIEAQADREGRSVGNCLGLTVLCNCLLIRCGLEPMTLYLENAFGIGPHVLTLLEVEDGAIDIENILPDGFDCNLHLDNPSRIVWGSRELAADVYHSLANEQFDRGEHREALENYEIALRLNPAYEKARLNRAILMDLMETDR